MVRRLIGMALLGAALVGLPAGTAWAFDAAADTAGGTDGTDGLMGTDGTGGTGGTGGTDGTDGTDGTPIFDTGKDGLSATELANEKGGCSLVPAGAGVFVVPLVMGLVRRRQGE